LKAATLTDVYTKSDYKIKELSGARELDESYID
jgi:hypothetical protein